MLAEEVADVIVCCRMIGGKNWRGSDLRSDEYLGDVLLVVGLLWKRLRAGVD